MKAAAPEVDPSVAALLARIERLEASVRSGGSVRAVAAPGPAELAQRPPTPPVAGPSHAARAAQATATAQAAQAQSAAEAEPASAGNGGPLGLDQAVTAWPAVVDIVRSGNAMLAALLTDARPVAVAEREITLAFPPGAAFLKRKAEQDDHRRATAEAVRAITGHALTLRYELREADPEQEPAGAPALSGEELVRRFLEEFDAEELIDDEPDEPEHDEAR